MTTGSVSPRRADTRRNHERILAAAAESLASCGEVSFNAIAKKAGVGVGTVYRHFPTPAALILAVYQREVDHLVEVIPVLLAEHPPEVAFRYWVIDHLARYMMTKHGLANALSVASSSAETLPRSAFEAIIGALDILVKANIEAGTVRRDLTQELVLRALAGLMHLDPRADWREQATSLFDLVWCGMGTRCDQRQGGPAPAE